MIEICIDATELRKALAEIVRAEENGFAHCLAVLRLGSAGPMIEDDQVVFSDLVERAHPTDPALNWGRYQGVTRRYQFRDGRLKKLGPR